jgi:hypothetical protein
MILKGDFNKCYNNTILGEGGHGCLIIPTRPEPQKWWAKHAFLEVQNPNSVFQDNLVEVIAYRHDPLPDNKDIRNNLELEGKPLLMELIQKAKSKRFPVVNGYGAYTVDDPDWTAGADWEPQSIGIKLEINAEVARSWELAATAGNKLSIPLPRKIRESNLNDVSKNRLQALFDTCWTKAEIAARRVAIRKRNEQDEGTAVYITQDKEVRRLHQQANARLEKRAGEVLAGSELTLFYQIMN